MAKTYLSAQQLAQKLHYKVSYIRCHLKDKVFIEGEHYVRPFGGRRILYIWENIERDMVLFSRAQKPLISMARGGVCHG